MKLVSITARNFKGINFALDLKAINFLVGSNFAGKTARTDAIRFLLLGYLPELGKTAAATFGLASGREMEVSGTFDNGQTMRRRRYLDSNTVKTDDTVLENLEDSPMAVMLNAETYFALSERERVNYVFKNIAIGDEFTPAGIIAKLNFEITNQFPANLDACSAGTKKLENSIVASDNAQAFVEKVIANLTADVKSNKEYLTRMQKTTQGIATISAQDTATARSISDIQTEIDALDSQMTELRATATAAQTKQTEAMRVNGHRQNMLDDIAKKPAILVLEADKTAKLQAITAQLEELPTPSDEATKKIEDHRSDVVFAIRLNEGDLALLTKKGKDIGDRETMIKLADACPCCGAQGEGWKEQEMNRIREITNALMIESANSNTRIEEKKQQLAALDALISKNNEQRSKHRTLSLQKTTAENDLAVSKRALAVIAGHEQTVAIMPAPEDFPPNEPLKLQIADLSQHECRLRAEQRTAIEIQHDQKRVLDAKKQVADLTTDLDVQIAAGKFMRKIQSEMVESAFKPLLATANSFFGDILTTPIAYKDGEIGTWRKGVWVGHRTFSGTEKALTYAAIQAALASNSPIRVMLLDEIGRLDQANAQLLIDAIGLAVQEGRIDQFVGIDATNRYAATNLEKLDSQLVEI